MTDDFFTPDVVYHSNHHRSRRRRPLIPSHVSLQGGRDVGRGVAAAVRPLLGKRDISHSAQRQQILRRIRREKLHLRLLSRPSQVKSFFLSFSRPRARLRIRPAGHRVSVRRVIPSVRPVFFLPNLHFRVRARLLSSQPSDQTSRQFEPSVRTMFIRLSKGCIGGEEGEGSFGKP